MFPAVAVAGESHVTLVTRKLPNVQVNGIDVVLQYTRRHEGFVAVSARVPPLV